MKIMGLNFRLKVTVIRIRRLYHEIIQSQIYLYQHQHRRKAPKLEQKIEKVWLGKYRRVAQLLIGQGFSEIRSHWLDCYLFWFHLLQNHFHPIGL